jgi:hypothetical protein
MVHEARWPFLYPSKRPRIAGESLFSYVKALYHLPFGHFAFRALSAIWTCAARSGEVDVTLFRIAAAKPLPNLMTVLAFGILAPEIDVVDSDSASWAFRQANTLLIPASVSFRGFQFSLVLDYVKLFSYFLKSFDREV